MNKLLALCLLCLSACGGSDPAATPSKDLFSLWTADDNSEIVSLVGGGFAVGQSFGYRVSSGENCLCSAAIGGSQTSATAILSGCAYTGGGGGIDPGCATLNRSYTMANTAAKLTICGSSCTVYH